MDMDMDMDKEKQDIWPELTDDSRNTRTTWKSITVEKLNELLSNNDVNTRTEYGRSALMLASSYNSNPKVIQALIDRGADIHARTDYGLTALMTASSNNDTPEVIQVLLDNGADVNAREVVYERTALMFALMNTSNPEVIKVLVNYIIKQGIEVDWNEIWELAQDNEDLKGTPVYWKINDLRFLEVSHT